MNTDLRLVKDKKGACHILSHKRCGITECIWLTADELQQLKTMLCLWKHADGDDLPEIDREVIALLDNGKVVFAHRPAEYWDGKNIATGKVTRYYPKTYDKGGWNIPNVKYWLDCSMPKQIEL